MGEVSEYITYKASFEKNERKKKRQEGRKQFNKGKNKAKGLIGRKKGERVGGK